MNEINKSISGVSTFEKQLKDLDKKLGALKTDVEKQGMLNIKEVKKLMANIDDCAQAKAPAGFSMTKGSPDVPSLMKLIQFFQTSKTAQETLTPTMVALFKSSLVKLKTSIRKSSKKKIKKVEKVAKGEIYPL